MSSTATLRRGARVLRSLAVSDGPVEFGRTEAILKRKLRDDDPTIPRRAARVEVDPEHAGTLLLTNPHEKIDLCVEMPDGNPCILRAQESMAIPSGVTLWRDVRLTYDLGMSSIYSQDTDDGDVTDAEAEAGADDDKDGGETQPSAYDWMRRHDES